MSHTHMRRRQSPCRCDAVAVALTLLAFGLFLWRADAKGIWWDEGLSLYRALRDVGYILSNRIDFPGAQTVDQHPPLYFLVLHAAIRGAGESDFVLRFPSVLSATLLVPLVYALGVGLRGRATGRVAALLAALSPFHLWYAQEARPYAMVAALSGASVLLLWRAAAGRDRRAAAASGIVAALAVATQFFAALVVLFQATWGVLYWWSSCLARGGRPSRIVARWWALPAVVLPVAVLTVALIAVRPLLPMLATQRRYVPLDIILLDALNSFSLGLSVNLRDVWAWDVAFGLTLLLGVASVAWRPPSLDGLPEGRGALRRALGLALLLGYLLIPAFGIWAVSLWVPVYMNSRYVIFSSPAFYLGVALGIDVLWRWRRVAGLAALIALLVGMAVSIQRYHRHERYATRQDYRGAAAYVAANERVGDLVVVTGHENLAPFRHYYRGNLDVVAAPARALELDALGAELQALGEDHRRLWLVESPAYVSDPEGRVARWLVDHMRREDHRAFPGYYGAPVTVHGFLPEDPIRPGGASEAPPLGMFGDRLALVGYTLRHFDVAGRPHEVAADAVGSPALVDGVPAGNVVSAALRVRAFGALPDLKGSLRLVNAEGIPWAQHDRELLRVLSTRDWPMGAEVRFDADLCVPPGTPPGTYDLQLVLYEADSLRPLDFGAGGSEGGPLRLGTVRVGRPARPFTRDAFLGVVPPLRPPAQFGRALHLEAFDLAPRSLGNDDTMTLHLFWRLLAADLEGYRLTINWTDAAGHLAHTTSHAVAEGADLSALARGDALHAILRLAAPDDLPPGDYGLHLLVEGGERGGYLWLRRGGLPWPSRNLGLGTVTIRGAAE